jgi:hypothetical protein
VIPSDRSDFLLEVVERLPAPVHRGKPEVGDLVEVAKRPEDRQPHLVGRHLRQAARPDRLLDPLGEHRELVLVDRPALAGALHAPDDLVPGKRLGHAAALGHHQDDRLLRGEPPPALRAGPAPAELFATEAIDATVTRLIEQVGQLEDPAQTRAEAAHVRIADYDAQLRRYRASIDAGGDPVAIGPWIAETQAKKVAAQAEIRTVTGRRQMSRDEIEAIVTALGDLARVAQEAEPKDKADIYAKLRLTLTYQPGEKLVQATIKPALNMCKGFVSEGGLEPPCPFGALAPQASASAYSATRTGRCCSHRLA